MWISGSDRIGQGAPRGAEFEWALIYFVYDGGRSDVPKAPSGLTVNSITSWVLTEETDCNHHHHYTFDGKT